MALAQAGLSEVMGREEEAPHGDFSSPRITGIKRQITPDSKFARQMRREGPYGKAVLQGAMGPLDAWEEEEEPEGRCQVCLLEQRRWVRGHPCLLNAHDRPVRVPGNFCSKECYEHV